MIEKIYTWLELAGRKFNDKTRKNMSLTLVKEEMKEFTKAVMAKDNQEIKDGFCDVIWTMINVMYDKGIPQEEVLAMIKAVEISNYSKFCTSEAEAEETCVKYNTGNHWDKPGVIIPTYYQQVGEYYIVRRLEDDKIMKSINYIKVS